MATEHCAYCGAPGPLRPAPGRSPLNSPRPVVFREYPPECRTQRTRIACQPWVCEECVDATCALMGACRDIERTR